MLDLCSFVVFFLFSPPKVKNQFAFALKLGRCTKGWLLESLLSPVLPTCNVTMRLQPRQYELCLPTRGDNKGKGVAPGIYIVLLHYARYLAPCITNLCKLPKCKPEHTSIHPTPEINPRKKNRKKKRKKEQMKNKEKQIAFAPRMCTEGIHRLAISFATLKRRTTVKLLKWQETL